MYEESTDMTATCEFEGNPMPEIQWFEPRHSFPIQNSSRVLLTELSNYTNDNPKYGGIVQSNLMIKNVSLDEAGEYQCIGSNTLGNVTEIYKVTIQKMTTSTVESSSDTPMSHTGKCLILQLYP